MIIYSIFQAEDIFSGWDEYNPVYEEVASSSGVTLQLERTGNNQLTISRLLSTDPQDYLKENYSPGVTIKPGLQI